MRISRRSALFAGLAIAALAGCNGNEKVIMKAIASDVETLDLGLNTPKLETAVLVSTKLGWKILCSAANGESYVISPSSLMSALAMVAEGATGATKDSFDQVFQLTGDQRSAAMSALRQALDQYDSLPEKVSADEPPKDPVVHLASRVLLVGDTECEAKYLDRIKTYYNTGVDQTNLDNAKAALDQWANKHTAGLIEESAIIPDEDTKLVLQDALLFAAKWRKVFSHDNRILDFHISENNTVSIKALADKFWCPYVSASGWQAIRLSYDDNLAMDIVLPEKGQNPFDWDEQVLVDSNTKLNEAEGNEVSVVMPPADLTAKISLKEELLAAGVNLSSFGGIFPGATVQDAAQQVKLIVTANGTVGAALTEIAMTKSSGATEEPIKFIVDRPYLMRVLDTRTGWPLFLAVVIDPRAK